MAFAIEGFPAIAQNLISQGVASNFYPRLPFLSALAAFTLTRNPKTPLTVGRPKVDGKLAGAIYSGGTIKPAEKAQMETMNAYQPRIQRYETSNSKWMGARDTNPTVSNATTNSHGQATQASALFYRARLKTPILIWHADKDRADQEGTEKGRALKMSQLIEEATEVAYQEHVKELNSKIWNGNPTNQQMDPWDQPLGILQAFSATNIYGNTDRSVAANSVWRALTDASWTSIDGRALLDDANVTKGIVDLVGRGLDLLITPKDLYLKFKAQLIAQGPVGVRVLAEGLPGMAEIGVKQECLMVDNSYVMYDASCPANNVLGFIMDAWKLILKPGKNVSVGKFVDLSGYSEGAKEADQAFVETEFFFSCDNPGVQVRYTTVGT